MGKITLIADIVVEPVENREDALNAIIGMLNDYEDMNPGAPSISMYIKPE